MNVIDREPTRSLRLVGAIAAFFIFACILVALLLVLEASGASQATILFVGKAFTYSGFGVIVVGWKWPRTVLGPFRFLLELVTRTGAIPKGPNQTEVSPNPNSQKPYLASRLQRGLFAMACIGLAPWFLMRFVREIWRSSGISDYLHSVFVMPLSPWFEKEWWWYTMLEWYDWPVLPCLAAACLAFAWPYTGARLVSWVMKTN